MQIPQIDPKTTNPVLCTQATLFLNALANYPIIKELVPHTCDSVNKVQQHDFRVRITQTRNGKKIVVSFTLGAEALCFMVKSSDKHNYEQMPLINALEGAARECDITVMTTVEHSQPPLERVRIKANTRERFHRLGRSLQPCRQRKPGYYKLAAS